MSLYYVHRFGQTTGPFPSERIAAMLGAGEMRSTDLVCAMGAETWEPVCDALGTRAVRRVARPYAALMAVLIVLGVIGVFVFFPVGVLLLVLGVVVDRKYYSCGACGNRVERSSMICPTCRAALTSEAGAAKKRK